MNFLLKIKNNLKIKNLKKEEERLELLTKEKKLEEDIQQIKEAQDLIKNGKV